MMEFEKKIVRSRPGLSQEEALTSLQTHPLYRPGTRVASIRRRGKIWVAELLEPVTAGGFPPPGGGDEGPAGPPPSDGPEESEGPDDSESSDSPSPDAGSDGPPSPDDGGGEPKHPGESGGGTEKAILHTLQQILHALGGGDPEPGIGGPDDLGPGGPPDGPPGGGGLADFGDSSAGAGSGPGAKLKPGEVPNRPGAVPLGSPAFASRQANPIPGAAPSGPAGAPSAGATCPPGYSMMNGQCVPASGAGGNVQPAGAPGLTAATYTVKRADNGMTIAQAQAELSAQWNPHGYKVARIKREGGVIRALVTKR